MAEVGATLVGFLKLLSTEDVLSWAAAKGFPLTSGTEASVRPYPAKDGL
jgi:hypothetical protein